MNFILNTILKLLNLYSLIIVVSAVLSWVQVEQLYQLKRVLNSLTEPALLPIRNLINRFPSFRGLQIDVSPIVLLMIIQFLIRLISRLMY